MKISEVEDSGKKNRYYRSRRKVLSGLPERNILEHIKTVEVVKSGINDGKIDCTLE